MKVSNDSFDTTLSIYDFMCPKIQNHGSDSCLKTFAVYKNTPITNLDTVDKKYTAQGTLVHYIPLHKPSIIFTFIFRQGPICS